MNATESKLVVHKTMSDCCLEILEDDEWLTQIVATNAETETIQKNIMSLQQHHIHCILGHFDFVILLNFYFYENLIKDDFRQKRETNPLEYL